MREPWSPRWQEILQRSRVQITLLVLTQVLGLAVWFSSAAVMPGLQQEWGISASAGAWLTMSTQIGFSIGALAFAVSGIFEKIAPHRLLGFSALGASTLTLAVATVASSLPTAVGLRFLTGVCLAGVYPVGLRLVASWSLRDRAQALGVLGGGLAVGSALPHLVNGFGPWPWRTVMVCAAAACALAGVIGLCAVRPGRRASVQPRQHGAGAVRQLISQPVSRYACLGYFGHMFELYAVWAWLPMFALRSRGDEQPSAAMSIMLFVSLGIGGLIGCVVWGRMADRSGRHLMAGTALAISGTCCLVSPLMFSVDTTLQVPFLFVWGAAVIADSGIFSTILSASTAGGSVGTALAVQTSIGFMITLITIQLTPVIADSIGWRYALVYLVAGPLFGIGAMYLGARAESGLEQSDAVLVAPLAARKPTT
ncbi:MFS transporter [Rhodococcus opacus]|uniref:MFS transporter n=1 Tax=Rhodococcus opacus TaxID=37919 RepID=UPI00294A126A|nr:MFS transporter [Rhodococcus opacus]MDV6244898.1 MFS transporter [Rhodococcus opacus]